MAFPSPSPSLAGGAPRAVPSHPFPVGFYGCCVRSLPCPFPFPVHSASKGTGWVHHAMRHACDETWSRSVLQHLLHKFPGYTYNTTHRIINHVIRRMDQYDDTSATNRRRPSHGPWGSCPVQAQRAWNVLLTRPIACQRVFHLLRSIPIRLFLFFLPFYHVPAAMIP